MTKALTLTPPALHGPTDKERKYDRQLRLWAASGQTALESAHILLVNSGSGTVGVEALKNLVLPGIGHFTIIDDAAVEDADLGVNFFLDKSSLGKPRSQCCSEFLLELNPEVKGDWYPKPNATFELSRFLENSPPFTMIVYTLPLPKEQIGLLQLHGQQHDVPLVPVRSIGYYSYFSIDLPGTFPIVDTHPDETATTDLRLLSPWPQLTAFAENMAKDIDSLNDHDHGHLPLVVILLHFLSVWRTTHDDTLPLTYSDKTAFRTLVANAMRRNNAEGGEENFEEAVAAVMKHIAIPGLPSSLQEIFDYENGVDETSKRSSFWIIAKALKKFYSENQRLPVAGGLPDMKAQSDVYIKLQNIYKEKARQDAHEVLATVSDMEGGQEIDSVEIELFCTNARFIKLINTEKSKESLNKIAERELANDGIAAIAGPEMPMSLLPIYLALTAMPHDPIASVDDIMAVIANQVPALKENERMKQIAQEVNRASGGELHNVSAVLGGMVAQEMIKVITKQYVPIDNVCIFDGIASRCQVLRI